MPPKSSFMLNQFIHSIISDTICFMHYIKLFLKIFYYLIITLYCLDVCGAISGTLCHLRLRSMHCLNICQAISYKAVRGVTWLILCHFILGPLIWTHADLFRFTPVHFIQEAQLFHLTLYNCEQSRAPYQHRKAKETNPSTDFFVVIMISGTAHGHVCRTTAMRCCSR